MARWACDLGTVLAGNMRPGVQGVPVGIHASLAGVKIRNRFDHIAGLATVVWPTAAGNSPRQRLARSTDSSISSSGQREWRRRDPGLVYAAGSIWLRRSA